MEKLNINYRHQLIWNAYIMISLAAILSSFATTQSILLFTLNSNIFGIFLQKVTFTQKQNFAALKSVFN